MLSYRKELWFSIPGRRAFININPQMEQALTESKIREGLALSKSEMLYHGKTFPVVISISDYWSRFP